MIRLTIEKAASILVNPDRITVIYDRIGKNDSDPCLSRIWFSDEEYWDVCEGKEHIREIIDDWKRWQSRDCPVDTSDLKWFQKPINFVDLMWYVACGMAGVIVASSMPRFF